MSEERSMNVVSEVTLTDGRRVRTESVEFRQRLPISAEMLDRLANASESHPGGEVWESVSALVTAVLNLEARGVQFDE